MQGCSIPVDKGSEIQIRQCRNMRHSSYTYPFNHHSATPHKYTAYASCLRSNSCQNKKAFQEHPSLVLSWYLDPHASKASYRPNFLAFHTCSGRAGSTFAQAEKTEKPLPLYKCPVLSSLLFYGWCEEWMYFESFGPEWSYPPVPLHPCQIKNNGNSTGDRILQQ